MKLSNAHCHPQFLEPNTSASILNSWTTHPILAAATTFEDSQKLIQLQQCHPHILASIGWHPWWIEAEVPKAKIDSSLEKFFELLSIHPLPIGEIGVDLSPKWKHSSNQQLYILKRFFQFAETLKRPIVLHCVRGHHIILQFLKQYPSVRIYLHHYQGNAEISAQYCKYDAYFGLPILHWSPKVNGLRKSIPSDRILLETDTCVHIEQVTQHVEQNNLSNDFIEKCRRNLFQFIQGTGADFSQQFEISM